MSDLFVQKSNHFLSLNNHKIMVKNGQGQIVKDSYENICKYKEPYHQMYGISC